MVDDAGLPTLEDLERFLARRHRAPIEDLAPLVAGFWSSAHGYRVGGDELVLRLAEVREGFEMDRAARAFARPGLPIPEVIEIGEAFDRAFAISRRAHGRFLEDVGVHDADRSRVTVLGLLDALRAVPAADERVNWHAGQSPPTGGTWRGWLADLLVDDPTQAVSGWRSVLAAEPALDSLYAACESRIGELLDSCPERRDLVHGDLLHRNVLVDAEATEISAVFSWKCSVRGDHLYDVAWLTFWAPWHPGIAAIDLWPVAGDGPDAALRHHCYELHVGARHLGWCAWTGERGDLDAVAARTAEVLERGPLPGRAGDLPS